MTSRRAFLAVAGTTLATGGCLSGDPPDRSTSHEDATPTEAVGMTDDPPGRIVVEMDGSNNHSYGGNYWFDPVGLHVPVDATVTWVSRQGAPHTATAYPERIPDGEEAFDSPMLGQQMTYERRFTVQGTYDYYCLPHRGQGTVGRIVCGAPGGPADGPTPDGPVPEAAAIVDRGRIDIREFASDADG